MKKGLTLLSLFLCAFSHLYAQKAPAEFYKPDEAAIKNIKVAKAYLVDVRTPEEFNSGHLKYATNIDYNGVDFRSKISKLDKNKPVYLYCRSGNRSGKAADTLKALGFNVSYNIGGFENLKNNGFAVDKTEPNSLTRTTSVH